MSEKTHIESGNTFSRNVANVAKMGAYYTDVSHCMRIGQLISWPEDGFCCLEPSVGDGTALRAVLIGAKNASTFGIELNVDAFKSTKESGNIDYLINADFLKGVKITQRAFTFMFANPPYGDYEEDVRLEQAFAEKAFGYLKRGALIAYVIPHYLLLNDRFVRSFYGRYEPAAVFKFDDDEFAKYKQIVIFAYRRESIGYMRSLLEGWLAQYQELEKIPYLPPMGADVGKKLPVLPSKESDIQFFTTLKFDADSFVNCIKASPLFTKVSEHTVEEYKPIAAGSPPLPLTKENSHMMAVCGAGSGLAGNEADGTLHLQRGVVENEIKSRIELDDNGKERVVETLTANTSLHIIDSEFNYVKLTAETKAEDGEKKETA